jgi:integrase
VPGCRPCLLSNLSSQHAQQYAKERAGLSASGINRGLRTLRRALNLAFQWSQLGRPVKIALAAGERQGDRVLLKEEENKYLSACPQQWRDCATVIFDEGFRPSEVFSLRWERVFFKRGLDFSEQQQGRPLQRRYGEGPT